MRLRFLDLKNDEPDRVSVLPSRTTRLSMRATFLQRLIDTAHALEGEVAYLRLKAALGVVDDARRAVDGSRASTEQGD